jgi:hypothetical protein
LLPIIAAVVLLLILLLVIVLILRRRRRRRERESGSEGKRGTVSHINPLYESGPNWSVSNTPPSNPHGLHVDTYQTPNQVAPPPNQVAPSTEEVYKVLAPAADGSSFDDPSEHVYSALDRNAQAESIHTVSVSQGTGQPASIYHVPFAPE